MDEHGLYLRVSPRGMKSWILRLNIQGLRTDNALGHYPALCLAEDHPMPKIVQIVVGETARRLSKLRFCMGLTGARRGSC